MTNCKKKKGGAPVISEGEKVTTLALFLYVNAIQQKCNTCDRKLQAFILFNEYFIPLILQNTKLPSVKHTSHEKIGI